MQAKLWLLVPFFWIAIIGITFFPLVSAQVESTLTTAELAAKVDILETINGKILNTIYRVIGALAALFAGLAKKIGSGAALALQKALNKLPADFSQKKASIEARAVTV